MQQLTRLFCCFVQFKSPVGMAAIYAHPIEFIFSNIVPLVVGSLVAKAHLFSMWVWFFVAIWSTIQHRQTTNTQPQRGL